jgi:hypothetical protein
MLETMKNGLAPVALLADPANAPFSFTKVAENKISLSSSLGVITTLDLSKLTAPAPQAGVDSTATKSKIRFGTTNVHGYNKDDTPAAASKNSFGVLNDNRRMERLQLNQRLHAKNPLPLPTHRCRRRRLRLRRSQLTRCQSRQMTMVRPNCMSISAL